MKSPRLQNHARLQHRSLGPLIVQSRQKQYSKRGEGPGY